MNTLVNKEGKEVGFLYHNVILLPGYKVSGVLLAHCVFTTRGEVKGKFLEAYIYNEAGEIIAQVATGESAGIIESETARIMKEAWNILSHATKHDCPWVVATETWSKMTLDEFLKQ